MCYHIRLRFVGFVAICLRSRVLVNNMRSIIPFRSTAYIDLACFHQLPCTIYCFQCLSRRFLKEFSVPADTMLDGELFQLFIILFCF